MNRPGAVQKGEIGVCGDLLRALNCRHANPARLFTTVFPEVGAFGAGKTQSVYDFSDRYGLIATPDRQAFRGSLFTTVFGPNMNLFGGNKVCRALAWDSSSLGMIRSPVGMGRDRSLGWSTRNKVCRAL